METLAKSDAFFFITSVSVVLLTIMGLVILFYLIRLARTAVGISKKIKEESDNISRDIASVRARVSEEGFGIRTIARLFSGFFNNTLGKRKKAPSSNNKNHKTTGKDQ